MKSTKWVHLSALQGLFVLLFLTLPAVGAGRCAGAVHVASRRWLSFQSLGHLRRELLFLTLLPLALFAGGCVYILRTANPPTDARLKIQAAQPQQYLVRVALEQPANYPVAADGHVSFTVPPFQHGCDIYLFGVAKLRDGAAEDVRVIEVRRDAQVIRKLSLTQIAKLPRDEAGYAVIKIED